MAKYKIEFDRNACIGSAACAAVCSKNWKISDEDGKADVLIAEIDDADLKCNLEAAKSCPVNVIHIIEKDTGKKLV